MSTATEVEKIDLRERVALRKLGNPAGFQFCRYEFLEPDTVKMTGCVVTRVKTRGPYKGQPAFDGPFRNAYVTHAEVAAEKRAFEAETGRCGECTGTGREWRGWNHITGHKHEPCRKCAGNGAAAKGEPS